MTEQRRSGATVVSMGPGRGHRMMGPGSRAKDAKGTMRRLLVYLGRQRSHLVLVILLVTVSSGLGVVGPWLMGRAIDYGIGQKDLAGLGQICLAMLGVYLVSSAATYGQRYIMTDVAQYTVRELRSDLFAKMQTLSLRFFDRRSRGDLMSRMTNDVENISNTLNRSVTQLISSALTILSVTAMMLALNYRLALVVVIILPVMLCITKVIAKRTRKGFQDQQRHLGALNTIIEETVTGARVVKAYRQEQAIAEDFHVSNQALLSASIQAQTFSLMLGPITNAVLNMSIALVAGIGGWLVLLGLSTVGTIAAFVTYTRQFGRPLNQIAQIFNTIQSALAGAERVFEIMDEEPDLRDAPDALSLENIRGHVLFEDVSFSYDKEVPVLKHVSFEALPGQMIALVGPTGAGKTTIVNLLTRFYDIDEGAILIDGRDIRQVEKDTLRRALGIVLQDTYLFSMTVKENIRYGRLDASDDEVIAAAKLANADGFIRRLPQGYDTMLSEDAGNLSQGQRQLLAIARAALANPSILILDEATSSVDTRTEAHIQEALLNLMKGRTSFVIAHRLSTIREADVLLVIHHGEIIERGNHRELLAQKGFYHDLYLSQFKGNAHLMPETVEDAITVPAHQGPPPGPASEPDRLSAHRLPEGPPPSGPRQG